METALHLDVGRHEMCGRRQSMEDISVVERMSLPHLVPHNEGQSLFMAVYDGHSGKPTADFVASKLHIYLAELTPTEDKSFSVQTCLEETFLKLDGELHQRLIERGSSYRLDSGTTALVCILTFTEIHVAHAGDCRCLIADADGKIVFETVDHKANLPTEFKRILEAGSYVSAHTGLPRVGGQLAVSRAFGDFFLKGKEHLSLKDQAVTAFPDVTTVSRQGESQAPKFVILACDGIWDKLDSVTVAEWVLKGHRDGKSAKDVATEIVQLAYKKDSQDNLSCIVCYL